MSYVSKAYDKTAADRHARSQTFQAQAAAHAAWVLRLEKERAAERAQSSKELRAQARSAQSARDCRVDMALGGNNPFAIEHGPCAQAKRLEGLALQAEAEGR